MKSLRPLTSAHDRALILGNGGAAAAVRFGLQSLGIDVVHVTRSPIEWEAMRYDTLNAAYLRHCKLVVQCTGGHLPYRSVHHLPWDGLTPSTSPWTSCTTRRRLFKRAERGSKTMNGKAMLIAQAEAAWEWWNATT